MTISAEPLVGLNPSQERAANATEGPLLVLAGAGSGKTRVLVARIKRLVDTQGVAPGHILAITFTKKAAAEMRHRLAKTLGNEQSGITVTTFHALGVQMLKRFGATSGLIGKFGIADEQGAGSRVRQIMKEIKMPLNGAGERPSEVAGRISAAKVLLSDILIREAFVSPERAEEILDRYRDGDRTIWSQAHVAEKLDFPDLDRFMDQYQLYQASLKGDNVVDYDDLLILPALMCVKRPETCRVWAGQWRYVLVDEYQDTDLIQDHLLNLLVKSHRNVCAVGDDDQAIYSWRGARVENIRTFPERYSPCVIVRLEENYRSTPEILGAANATLLARAAEGRRPKLLRTDNPSNGPVRIWQSSSQEVEASTLVKDLLKARREQVIANWDDVFVLYRVNGVARGIEVALKRAGIPYRIANKLSLHERAEAKPLLAYARLAENPYDTTSFEMAVSYPPRGVGPANIEMLRARARAEACPIFELLDKPEALLGIKPGVIKAIEELQTEVGFLNQQSREENVGAAIQALIERIGTRERLIALMAASEAEDDDEEAEAIERRLHDLDDLLLYIEEFVQRRPMAAKNLGDLLEDVVSYRPGDDGIEDERRDAAGFVTLMSVHAAKGLEAPRVYVIGLEETVFPLDVSRSPDPKEALSEEARLFYVAVTRAEKELILSSARTRELRRGEIRPMAPSRFLTDLPETIYRQEIYSSHITDEEMARISGEADEKPRILRSTARA